MSRRFSIAVPAPADRHNRMSDADAMSLAVESFRADADAHMSFGIPLDSLLAMARRPHYPAALRATAWVAATPGGRVSRARYTPEERKARRTATL